MNIIRKVLRALEENKVLKVQYKRSESMRTALVRDLDMAYSQIEELKALRQFANSDDSASIETLGHQARECLNNPVFVSAYKKYEKELLAAWKNSSPMQDKERESIWHRQRALEAIRLKMTGFVSEMLMEQKIKQPEGVSNVSND